MGVCLFSEIVLNVMCPILAESKASKLLKITDYTCFCTSIVLKFIATILYERE